MFVKYIISVAVLALIVPKPADSVTCACSGDYQAGTDNAADTVLDQFDITVPGAQPPKSPGSRGSGEKFRPPPPFNPTPPQGITIIYPPTGTTSTAVINYIKVDNLSDGLGTVTVTSGGVGSTSVTIQLPGGYTTRTYNVLIKGQ